MFNWLFARAQGGEFKLRIENTDTSREVAQAVDQIQESLRWLGLDWDGDHTFQLDRMDDCREVAQRLVAEGKAYEDDGAIRFRMPDEGTTGWEDVVRGRIEFPNDQLEDLVLVRSDGRPTYNFASPMEDVWDGITHVIRGDDHVSNTPKQINLIRAVGAEPPVYAHVPSVFGTDGKKLSKRHGAVSVEEFRDAGYIAPALLNFLSLLGWAPDGETTIMSRDELVERFDLSRVQSSPAAFDFQKLDWMNGVYLRALPPDEYAHELLLYLGEQGYDWDAELVHKAAPLVQEKIEKLGDFPAFAGFLFGDISLDGHQFDPALIEEAERALGEVEPFTAEAIEPALRQLAERLGLEAARGVRADQARRHGLEGVAGVVREPRAPRQGARARAAQRRPILNGLGEDKRVERPLESDPRTAPKRRGRLREPLEDIPRPGSLGALAVGRSPRIYYL